jgi:hypothetical protein
MAARREGKSRRIKYQIVDRYSTIVAEEDRYMSFEEVPWSSFGEEYNGDIQGFGFDS